jgi:hypothetical protein
LDTHDGEEQLAVVEPRSFIKDTLPEGVIMKGAVEEIIYAYKRIHRLVRATWQEFRHTQEGYTG